MSKGKNKEVTKEREDSVERGGPSEPAITFGTEVERYKVVLSKEQQQEYRKQLDKAIKAHAINSLDLDQIFPADAAEKASLCIIEKEGIPFMEVLFDDNVEMTQLEFISIPYQDPVTEQYTGGVKKLEKFFTLENIKDICKAMNEFRTAFENISSEGESAKKQKFTFEFPEYAQKLFKGVKLDDTKQGLAVHITHSLPISNDHNYLKKLNEFLTAHRDTTLVQSLQNQDVFESQLKMFKKEFDDNLLDQTFPPHLSHSWGGTAERNVHEPLFKMPRAHLYGNTRLKNAYIRKVINGEVLAPTSNLVEHTMHEIAIYSELLKEIKAKIVEEQGKSANTKSREMELDEVALLTSRKEAAALEQLQTSKIKLEETILGLKEQVVESVAAVKPLLMRYLNSAVAHYSQLTKVDQTELSNISIFDSFEEKLKQVGLCEHRGGIILHNFSRMLNHLQGKQQVPLSQNQGIDDYIAAQCSNIIEGFKLLKEAVIIAEKAINRNEEQQQQNDHLKRVGKAAGESHDIKETFAATNTDNLDLLEKMRKEAVITADIDLKAVDVKEQVTSDKVGKVEFLAESSHIRDHPENTKSLIDRIESGDISKNTVIAIERKSYGQTLGVPDVIMLASIIEHNEKNPAKRLKVPADITKDSLIYQDAILYNTAKKHGVKVVGLEGRNLKAGKELPEEYNAAREDYMASRITQLSNKGYNVIAYVGSAHVENLEKAIERKLENRPSVENPFYQVSEELQKVAASIGQNARAHVTSSSLTTSSIPVIPNENQSIKRNSGVGGR